MAYEKQTWQCGDTITADKLNHIEDGIEEALECCGSGGDVGYSCAEERVTLTDQSVTTTMGEGDTYAHGVLSYTQFINADKIAVTFDGMEYECPLIVNEFFNGYGGAGVDGPDFSEYPFAIMSTASNEDEATNDIYTQEAGTYQIKVVADEETIETTECFDKARGYRCTETYSLSTDESVTTTADGSGNNRGELSISLLSGTIRVTFNGAEYICSENEGEWGAPFVSDGHDWSEFPFCIYIGRREMLIDTQAPGTYQIKIESAVESIETSECFAKAVNKVVKIPEPTPSLSKVVLRFEEEEHEPFGDDDPIVICPGHFVGDFLPTVSDIQGKYNEVEYYATYNNMLMPLTYISSSLAKFSAFEQVTVNSKSYIRHHEITYTSSGSTTWHRYDIEIPTSY